MRCKNGAVYFLLTMSLRETDVSISLEDLECCFVTQHLENNFFPEHMPQDQKQHFVTKCIEKTVLNHLAGWKRYFVTEIFESNCCEICHRTENDNS